MRFLTAWIACSLVLPTLAGPDALAPAAAAIGAKENDRALEELHRAFESGYPAPADIYADPRFSALREDPAARGPWRELMGRFVRQSELSMVPASEPGTPMEIRGRLIGSAEGRPVPGAIIHLYHTDDSGNYEPGRPAGDGSNPRLFAWVLTDADGEFTVHTIKPRHYPGSTPRFAHVHYRVIVDGQRRVTDEFRPYTEPADADERRAELRRGHPISVVREEGAGLICEVTIPMGTP